MLLQRWCWSHYACDIANKRQQIRMVRVAAENMPERVIIVVISMSDTDIVRFFLGVYVQELSMDRALKLHKARTKQKSNANNSMQKNESIQSGADNKMYNQYSILIGIEHSSLQYL
jgi:hypothetical protein